ncbi:MAG: hypothetical protein RL032_250, partial [Pseudomonadota bacterium]
MLDPTIPIVDAMYLQRASGCQCVYQVAGAGTWLTTITLAG